MLNLKVIRKALEETVDTEYDMSGLESIREEEEFEYKDHKFSYEEQFGGEGQGDDYWVVFSVEDKEGNKLFYKIPGYYQSHHGAELETEDTFQVERKEKVISVWEKVRKS